MLMSTPSLSGSFFLSAFTQATYLQFDDWTRGGNLTTWKFSGRESQQWTMIPSGGGYKIQNRAYGGYISSSTCSNEGGIQLVCQANEAQVFYVKKFPGVDDGYIISPDPRFETSLNVMGGSNQDDTPVITFPLNSMATNSIFLAIPIEDSPTPTSTPGAKKGGLSSSDVIAIAIGVPAFVVACLGALVGRNANYRRMAREVLKKAWKKTKIAWEQLRS